MQYGRCYRQTLELVKTQRLCTRGIIKHRRVVLSNTATSPQDCFHLHLIGRISKPLVVDSALFVGRCSVTCLLKVKCGSCSQIGKGI